MNRRTFLKGLGISAAVVGAGAFQKKGAQAEKGEQVWRMVTSWSKKLTPIFQNGAEQL
jgi:TRAP-type mannitol/chloroaromatic compound transport system substrate-binding protein